MADNQVALSRISRATDSSLSKGLRQNVPPFLQKLYEMVSDSATDNLIRWSDNGDSFFVLDHERVAHDVLPRWFKHSNFASFVRQLNMYGFHKIPHLQQGVLKSESETEIWNFEHPNFRKGQPDLLCLITRKKQAQERPSEDISLGEKDGTTPGLVGGFNPGSLVDINSIINGIAAIKRHQATISADLNDLKASNQHLWQEALEARERHQKQQDTINRILKFLAGVFGNAGAHKAAPVHGSPRAGIPRKRQRLMIEGAAQSDKDKPLEPLDGVEPMIETVSEDGNPADRFVEVTPSPVPSKAPSVVPETPGLQNIPHYQSDPPMTADIVMGGNFPTQQPFIPFSSTAFPTDNDNSAIAASYPRPNDSITPTALTSTPSGPKEELLQSIVNSPGAMQRLLSLLNFQAQQQNIPMPPPLDLNDTRADSTNYTDSTFNNPYVQQPYQHPVSEPTLAVPNNFDIVEPDPQTMSLLHTDDLSSGINFEPYIENANRLKETDNASSVIAEHVNMMDSNIDSLMKHLGLDPHQLDGIRDDEFGAAAVASPGGGGSEGELFNHDQNEQQQQHQHQQSLPNRNNSNSNASSNSDLSATGINTNASTTNSSVNGNNIIPTPAVTTNTNATVAPFQTTVPEFDFNVFLNELAKQNGETPAGPGFGDYKPDLDALMMDVHAPNNNNGVDLNNNNNKNNNHDPTTSPQLSAFVDEVASQSGQSDVSNSPPRTRASVSDDLSPNVVTSGLPDVSSKNTGIVGTNSAVTRKRKSEVETVPPDATATTMNTRAQTKTKRKR
ncbi:CTA8 [Sanghuangporus vaninii]